MKLLTHIILSIYFFRIKFLLTYRHTFPFSETKLEARWDLSLKMGTDEIQILFQKQILRIIVLPIGDTNIYE